MGFGQNKKYHHSKSDQFLQPYNQNIIKRVKVINAKQNNMSIFKVHDLHFVPISIKCKDPGQSHCCIDADIDKCDLGYQRLLILVTCSTMLRKTARSID